MAQHTCTGCVPIDAKIIDVYIQLLGLKDSTIEAAERAEYAAEQAIGKSPYIGENGDWWEWDDEQGAFIDTGVQAQGSIAVDTAMSSTSTNPVQNKVITQALNKKYTKPATGIPASDLAGGVIPDVSGFYTKPANGIPADDIADGVIPDVSQFITASANNLVNYYLKSETYNKSEVQEMIGAIQGFSYEVVASLPTASASTKGKIYLVPSSDPQTQNVKDEFITIDNGASSNPRYTWEQIGSTAIDLSGYVTTTQLNTALAAYTTTANLTTLLATKQDTLVSGTNIKTVNGESILGSGDIAAGDPNAVKYVAQTLTDAQKTQAQTNIGAAAASALSSLETAIAAKYSKPSGGIPETDLASAVQSALALARTSIQSLADYYSKTEVDALLDAVGSEQYVDVTTLPTASASTLGKIYLVGPDANGFYDRYYTSYDGSTYSWVAAGNTEINLANYATKSEVSQLQQKVGEFSLPIISDKTVALGGTIGATIDLTPKNETGWNCVVFPCVEGDSFTINGSGGNSTRLWGFVDAENKLIAVSTAGLTGTDIKVVAPANSANFVSNGRGVLSVFCRKYGSLPDVNEKVYDLEERVYGMQRTNSNTPYTPLSKWENSDGTIGIGQASVLNRVSAISVSAGSAIRVVSDMTGAYNDVGYFCNDRNAIVGTISRQGNATTYEGIVPAGAKRLYINFVGSFSVDVSGDIDKLSEIQSLVETAVDEYGARTIEDNTTPLELSEDDFVLGNLNGSTGAEISAGNVVRSGFLAVVPGAGFAFQTSNNYRCDIFMYDADKAFITHFGWQTGIYTGTLRERASYIRIVLASPSGTSTAPVWEDAALSVTIDKKYAPTRALGEEDVQKVVNGYFDLELPIFAPSPQLPANASEDSDFNAETVTSTDIISALDSLIESIQAPNAAYRYMPKFITKYGVSGLDATGVYPIHTYAMGLRNRYAWRYADELYAWKNGNDNVVYIDSCSPRVGDTIYSSATRANSGKTVVSYDSATRTMVDSSSVSYTRDEESNVPADMIWTTNGAQKTATTTTTYPVYGRDGNSLGNATFVDATHLSLNGKSYQRAECFDYHTESKATIFIWGNEHGPTSDPIEPSIILYRFAKDLCGGARNNPFLSFIKNYCKIVFIPCANPYGCQYPRVYGRNNGNGVNLNRNYDTPGWAVQADADKGNYAGDQSETQYIMNMCKRFSPDISIDIHCLGFGNPVAEGTMYLSETYIPDQEFYATTQKVLRGLGYEFDQRGNPEPLQAAHGSEWLYYNGMGGGVFEMNAGAYSDNAHTFNGKQHTAAVMEACYTEFLNCIRMWLAQFDPTLDLSKLGIK